MNLGRRTRLLEELKVLKPLPAEKYPVCKRQITKVGSTSTINIMGNTYSVDTRLIGERIESRVYAEQIEIWHGQKKVDTLPRLKGDSKHRINYHHIIGSLVRKPGAFENYRYREELFPDLCFRMTYELLKKTNPIRATREYLEILHLAALEGEEKVETVLRKFLIGTHPIDLKTVACEMANSDPAHTRAEEVRVPLVELRLYDALIGPSGEACE